MSRSAMAGIAVAALIGACAMYPPGPDAAPPTDRGSAAEADLSDSRSTRVAQAKASESGDGIMIRLEATRLPPGAYGAHIHAVGRCDPPDFSTAGAHWNPGGQQHGRNNPQGMHLGDLPNLMIGADGRGTLEIKLAGASLAGRAAALLDGDGAAIVVHERPDDYQTDPSGNSGARIACGVFR